MTIEEILMNGYMWKEGEVEAKREALTHISHLTDEDKVNEKAEFYIKTFFMTYGDLLKVIKVFPQLLGLSEEYVLNKIGYYVNLFGDANLVRKAFIKFPQILSISNETIDAKIRKYRLKLHCNILDIKTMWSEFPSIFHYSDERIDEKIDHLLGTFGVDVYELMCILARAPQILGLSSETITAKRDFYCNKLGFSSKAVAKFVRDFPTILGLSNETVLYRFNFFKAQFGLDDKQVAKMFTMIPQIVALPDETIMNKQYLFSDVLGVSKGEFSSIISRHPQALTISATALKYKAEQLASLGITRKELLNDPMILSSPANMLKVRYIILRQVATREEILKSKGWYMFNQKKLFFRYKYIKDELKCKPALSDLLRSQQRFVAKFGFPMSDDEDYTLTIPIIEELAQKVAKEEKIELTRKDREVLGACIEKE